MGGGGWSLVLAQTNSEREEMQFVSVALKYASAGVCWA